MAAEAEIAIGMEDISDLPSIQMDIVEDVQNAVILLKIVQPSAITARNMVISSTIALSSSGWLSCVFQVEMTTVSMAMVLWTCNILHHFNDLVECIYFSEEVFLVSMLQSLCRESHITFRGIYKRFFLPQRFFMYLAFSFSKTPGNVE